MEQLPLRFEDSVIAEGITHNDKVRFLEAVLSKVPQVDLKTSNLLYSGMFARTILIPAGTVLTGAETNLDNISVMFGDITVTTANGTRRLTGFHVLPAAAGYKRAGVAHQDTYWTTIHRTELTELAQIEEEMTAEASKLQSRCDKLNYKGANICLGE